MHELSLCQAIVDTVTTHAAGRPLRRVHVRIGHLRQVVPDSLRFCWDIATDGSALAGAELAVEHVPAVIACRTCGARTTLVHPLLLCDACDGADVAVESGEELQLVSIELAEPVG